MAGIIILCFHFFFAGKCCSTARDPVSSKVRAGVFRGQEKAGKFVFITLHVG